MYQYPLIFRLLTVDCNVSYTIQIFLIAKCLFWLLSIFFPTINQSQPVSQEANTFAFIHFLYLHCNLKCIFECVRVQWNIQWHIHMLNIVPRVIIFIQFSPQNWRVSHTVFTSLCVWCLCNQFKCHKRCVYLP